MGVGGTRPLWNVFREALRDDFRSKLKNISFLSQVMFISRSFLFPALLQNLAPNVPALGILVSTMSWSSFRKLRSVTGHFLVNYNYDHEHFWKISFLFSKQSRCSLPDSYGDPQAEQSSLVVVRRKLEWKRYFRSLARSSAEGPSIVVSRLVQVACGDPLSKRDKSPTKSACDYPLSSTKTNEETSEF